MTDKTTTRGWDEKIDDVRNAIAVLVADQDYITSADRGWRGTALADLVAAWDSIDPDDATWKGVAELVRPNERFDSDLNTAVASLLAAAFDAYADETDESGLSFASLTTMQDAAADIAKAVARAADRRDGRDGSGKHEDVQNLASALGGLGTVLSELAVRLPNMVDPR